MSTCTKRTIVALVALTYALSLLACLPPGPTPVAGGKPAVSITAPAAGAQFAPGDTVTVQVMAADASGVARVELLVDNALVAANNLQQPMTTWQGSLVWVAATPGAHALLVQATNAAGAVSDPAVLSVLVTEPAGPTQVVVQPPTPVIPGATTLPTQPLPGLPTVQSTTPPTKPATVPPTKPPTVPPTKPPTAPPTKPPTPTTGFSNLQVKVLSDTRIRVTVNYAYDGTQGDTVLVVAEPAGGTAAGAAFNLTPSPIQKGQGTVKVETEYQGVGTVTSQRIELVLSNNMGQNFYRQSFDHQQTWKASVPSTVVYDFVAQAQSAQWKNYPGQATVPFGEANCTDAGCVFLRSAPATVMEDGSQPAQVLVTRPQWVANGEIKGTFNQRFTIQAGDRLVGQVGLIAGAATGDVKFVIFIVPVAGPSSARIVDIADTSNGALKSFDASLDQWAGQEVIFDFSVVGGPSPDDDWAAWVEAKLMR
ncbi:MAG: hypothetical protein KKA73_07220 [Chloroflexi bacterium]|nr:hypothetical protein [Chloroflexota bacterium]MBU1747461.1 hypothetical protein [Chloroflexota bacterium]